MLVGGEAFARGMVDSRSRLSKDGLDDTRRSGGGLGVVAGAAVGNNSLALEAGTHSIMPSFQI